MESRKILSLFLCNFAILFVGMGLFPLLPVYAAEFGATPAMIGIYLAVIYVAITLGTMVAGWVSSRLSRKAVFVAAGALGVPALALMGQATALWQVVVLTSMVWFTGGIGISLVSVFIGLQSSAESRGRWFSLNSLTTPLGAIMGGFVIGWLVEWQGYTPMFIVSSMVYAIWPLVGLWIVDDKHIQQTVRPAQGSSVSARSGKTYHLLLMAVLLSAMTISIIRLGVSLSMKLQEFSPAAIAGTNVIGGLVTIPIVLGFGVLSDRLGRRLFLTLGYVLAAISGVILVMATHLWQYWVVAAAMLAARSISGSLAPALAADVLPPESLGRSLPWLGTVTWIAGVLGFAGSGYAIQILGGDNLYLIATALSLAAAGFVATLPRRRAMAHPERSPQRVGCLEPSVSAK